MKIFSPSHPRDRYLFSLFDGISLGWECHYDLTSTHVCIVFIVFIIYFILAIVLFFHASNSHYCIICNKGACDSVLECLTRDRRAAGTSLIGGTALNP